MRIKDFNDEPHSTAKIKLLSSRKHMNTLFKTNDEIKRRRCYRSIHKDMRITFDIHQKNKRFYVTVQPKNSCKLEFSDNLWLPYLNQTQSEISVFEIFTCHIYNILVTKWKNGIDPNYIITFTEELEFI